MSEQLTPQPGDTAADLKMKIEKLQAQRAEAKGHSTPGAPLADGKTPGPSNRHSEPNPEQPNPASASPQAQPAPAAKGEKTTPSKEQVDLQEWARSKGINWTSETSVLDALRRSDQEFHKRHQEKAKDQPVAPVSSYQPSYPANGNGQSPPQNGYAPPPPVQLPRATIEQIARNYNMAPEDAERLIAFNNDFMETKLNIERQRLQKEFEQIKRANSKNDIFRELSSDPTFRNPQVMQEFYRTKEEMQENDPRSFEEDPNAYKRAYDQALINIARRNLQGDVSQNQDQAGYFALPSNPPRPTGNGGTGETQRENELSGDMFAKLSVEEQRAVLSKMGLISAKY